jgi:hypothetical protein
MKKQFLIAKILFFSLFAFSQSSQLNNQFQIDQLKLSGNLPVDFQIVNSHVASPVIYPRIYNSVNRMQSANICNCMIPIDTTFTIVQFDGSGGSGGPGVPPEYRNDDWSSVQMMLPFTFCYFGQSYNSFYINNNGNISFDGAYSTFTANSFPDPTYKMIAPFWADVDTRGPLSGLVYYKATASSLIIIWDHVGYFSNHDSLRNTCQLIITDGQDPLVPNGNTSFCYGDMQWSTGDASGGLNGFGGTPATVGANLGDGINYIQFGLFDQPGSNYDGPYNLNDGIDWLDSANFIFDLCPANVPPVSVDCMNDTVVMHVMDTQDFDYYFMAPEPNQNTVINLQAGSLANFTILSNNSGNYAHLSARLIADPANIGYNVFTITATDNGSPAATTTFSRVVEILPATGISQRDLPQISILPNPMFDESILTIKDYPFQNIMLQLTDVTGRIVLLKKLDSATTILSKKDISKGIYMYQLTDKNGLNMSGKLVVN